MGFPTTRWSLLVASGDQAAARQAWDELARRYRAPIHAWFRSRYGADRADDLTHAFFAESIAGDWWARADIDRGSFRTYLRMLLQRFGTRHGERYAIAGGDDQAIAAAAGGETPEHAYERAFAQTLVAHAMDRLRDQSRDDPITMALLLHVVERGEQGDLKQLASALGVLQNTLSQRLRRLKLRLRELLREEFSLLVVDPAQVDVELRLLRDALSRD